MARIIGLLFGVVLLLVIAGALTSILQGDVHPTAPGYQSLAFATTQSYRP